MAALAEARRHLPGLEIDLIGPDFGSGQKAETWAGERGIAEAFHFHGPLPYADVLRVLATADLLVHPSLEESFGMTVAEAMALGIPVVVGENAGALPWVTGEGTAGLLVDVTSSAAITEAVLRLLGEPALYARCSAAGRARAESAFSARNVAQAYIARYQAVLGGVPAACQAGNDCVETTA
jgi:glycosyltransferase involved in cell wall biosynthesis